MDANTQRCETRTLKSHHFETRTLNPHRFAGGGRDSVEHAVVAARALAGRKHAPLRLDRRKHAPFRLHGRKHAPL